MSDDFIVPGRASKPGGDGSVERDGMGRPRIIVTCEPCEGYGKVYNPNTDRMNKCQKCRGEGRVKRSYTRTTTYIDVLDSKDNLMEWKARKVLQGVAKDPSLLDEVLAYDDTEKDGRNWLNRRAEAAATKAGAGDKAEQGTWLHELSEFADTDSPLPEEATEADLADIMAYSNGTCDLVDIHLMEKLMVHDGLKVAGTPDRVSFPKRELIAPDGTRIGTEDKLITDLKTGRVDYGGLKMSMQLSIYSRSMLYLPDGTREAVEGLRTDWGLIMHLPAGESNLTIYWADLNLGWDAVQIAKQVRGIRSRGKGALIPFES